MRLSDKITHLRKSKGMSQEELASTWAYQGRPFQGGKWMLQNQMQIIYYKSVNYLV